MKTGSFCALFLLAVVPLAAAGTIRHDRDDSLYTTLAASPAYSSVGQFIGSTGSYNYLGSGTLITPNWVLTAAHVVDQAVSLSFNVGGAAYSAANWTYHSSWTGDLAAGYDIALVQLSSSVTGINPAMRYTGSSEIGAIGTSVGFGRTGTGLTGSTVYDGKKRAGQNVIDQFYSRNNNRLFLSDFDNPLNAADNVYGSSSPLDLEYLIAPGDSGGGLFLDFGSGPLLAGVHSFGAARDGLVDSDYGDMSGHIRVSAFNSWIDSIIGVGSGGGSGGGPKGGNGKGGKKFADGGLYAGAVPEPNSLMLMLAGAAAMAGLRRRAACAR